MLRYDFNRFESPIDIEMNQYCRSEKVSRHWLCKTARKPVSPKKRLSQLLEQEPDNTRDKKAVYRLRLRSLAD